MQKISRLVKNLLASQKGLCSMELLKSTYTSLQQSIEHRIIQNRMFRVKQVLRRKHEIVAYKDSMHKIGSSLIGAQLVRYNCNTVSVNRWRNGCNCELHNFYTLPKLCIRVTELRRIKQRVGTKTDGLNLPTLQNVEPSPTSFSLPKISHAKQDAVSCYNKQIITSCRMYWARIIGRWN